MRLDDRGRLVLLIRSSLLSFRSVSRDSFRATNAIYTRAFVLFAAAAVHAGEYKVVAKNEGGEAVSCADLRVVQPLPDVGLNAAYAPSSTYAPAYDANADKVNVVRYSRITQ